MFTNPSLLLSRINVFDQGDTFTILHRVTVSPLAGNDGIASHVCAEG